MKKDESHPDRMMGSLYLRAATNHGVTHPDHKEQLRPSRQRRDGLNVAAGQADIAQVAEHRGRSLIAAQLHSAAAMQSLMASPGSWRLAHSAPDSARRPYICPLSALAAGEWHFRGSTQALNK